MQEKEEDKEEELQGKFLQREVEDEEVQKAPEEDEVQAKEDAANLPSLPRRGEPGSSLLQGEARRGGFDLQRQPEEEETAQAKGEGGAPSVSPSVESGINSIRGGGQPLPESTRSFMEPRFGADFSGVRVHTDSNANHLARSINAKAFTLGKDIVFGPGQHSPVTAEGKRLMAHELTHTIQQTGVGSPMSKLQREEAISGFTPKEVEEYSEEYGAVGAETGEEARKTTGEKEGITVRKPGIMACTPKSPNAQYLRKLPTTLTGTNVVVTLKFNDRIFVEESGGAGNKWYKIVTSTGKLGWVPFASVALDPPEPNANLYRVKQGETPFGIASRWYGPFQSWWMIGSKGHGDARFYISALAFVNKGRAGMPSPDSLKSVSAWKSVTLISEHTIWKPSKSFLNLLQGKVSSGSITRELWEEVKKAAKTVWGWIVYAAAFVAGLLYGAVESVYDLFAGVVDLVKMIWSIGKSIFTGNFIQDAKSLWNDLKKISFSGLAKAFLKKWNTADPWDQGFFRGRVLGYIIMEILMLVFSGGILTALKWTGKFAKIGALIAKLPRIAKVARVAQNAKFPGKVKKFMNVRFAGKLGTRGAKILGGIKKGRVAIETYLKSAEHINKRVASFKKYMARGGTKSRAAYDKLYDTLTRNRMVGALAEKQFQRIMAGGPKSYWVRVGGKNVLRKVDNVLGNVAREVKSGPLKLTPFIRKQILKDIQLIKTKGLKVEWHLLAGGDPKAIAALHKAGIKVIIY